MGGDGHVSALGRPAGCRGDGRRIATADQVQGHRFDEVLGILRELNVDEIWAEATDQERRVLVEEFLDVLAIFPDHLEVTVKGAPRLNVTVDEVGLKGGW